MIDDNLDDLYDWGDGDDWYDKDDWWMVINADWRWIYLMIEETGDWWF